jgi:hypothetical protein
VTPTELEERLVDLAAHVAVPDGDDLRARVVASLAAEERPAAGRRPLRRRLVALVAVVLVGAGAAASPALADWLGLRGVRLRDERPAGPPAGTTLDLGEPTTLADAAEDVGFRPLVPARLGPPDAVWIERRALAPVVTLVYGDDHLVGQVGATLGGPAVLEKFTSGATVEHLEVGGDRAVWIDGVHEVALLTRDGYRVEPLRLADRVLLVERDDRVVRVETRGDRAEAVAIAASLR